jgi:hypothetical protein
MSGEQREARPIIISQEKKEHDGLQQPPAQDRDGTSAATTTTTLSSMYIPSIFLFLSKTIENFFLLLLFTG